MPRILTALLLVTLLSGCSQMRIEEYRGTGPALVLEEYFAGPVRAWGLVQDRSGKVRAAALRAGRSPPMGTPLE